MTIPTLVFDSTNSLQSHLLIYSNHNSAIVKRQSDRTNPNEETQPTLVWSDTTTPNSRTGFNDAAPSGAQAHWQVATRPTKKTPGGLPDVETPTIKLANEWEKESKYER